MYVSIRTHIAAERSSTYDISVNSFSYSADTIRMEQKTHYENLIFGIAEIFNIRMDDAFCKLPCFFGMLSKGCYDNIAERVRKKLGLTEDDVQRAWSLRRHHSDRHFWHDIRFRYKGEEKLKKLDKAERKLKPSDNALEAELKAEDDFIMDVYDEYYDPEKDMSR